MFNKCRYDNFLFFGTAMLEVLVQVIAVTYALLVVVVFVADNASVRDAEIDTFAAGFEPVPFAVVVKTVRVVFALLADAAFSFAVFLMHAFLKLLLISLVAVTTVFDSAFFTRGDRF